MSADHVSSAGYFEADAAAFAQRFDRETIAFRHRLAGHHLFARRRLMQLARYLAAEHPDGLYFDSGDVDIGTRWEHVPKDLPVDVLLESVESGSAWIVLRSAEKDPEFNELLTGCLDELSQLSGINFRKVMKLKNAIVFISSPHRIASYHIDRECNSLLQIEGTKTVHVFDRRDRDVLTEAEIECFWAVDNNAPVYKPQYEHRATLFELVPGDALHIPVNSPHWVKNGPHVSVSLSVNFHYREDILADIYRANHVMRRFGFHPMAPRISPLHDAVKRAAWGTGRTLRKTLRELQHRS